MMNQHDWGACSPLVFFIVRVSLDEVIMARDRQ